jgi:hypothetical protein
MRSLAEAMIDSAEGSSLLRGVCGQLAKSQNHSVRNDLKRCHGAMVPLF